VVDASIFCATLSLAGFIGGSYCEMNALAGQSSKPGELVELKETKQIASFANGRSIGEHAKGAK